VACGKIYDHRAKIVHCGGYPLRTASMW
jgi:hypothetical protein